MGTAVLGADENGKGNRHKTSLYSVNHFGILRSETEHTKVMKQRYFLNLVLLPSERRRVSFL